MLGACRYNGLSGGCPSPGGEEIGERKRPSVPCICRRRASRNAGAKRLEKKAEAGTFCMPWVITPRTDSEVIAEAEEFGRMEKLYRSKPGAPSTKEYAWSDVGNTAG